MLLLLIGTACSDKEKEWPVIQGKTMGTDYSVIYDPAATRIVWKRLKDQIDDLLSNINNSMSTYIDDSELSLLNQVNMQIPIVISDELFHVINSAQQVSEITGGAFDITVGPLVNLWGFGPNPSQRSVPSDEDIQFVQQHVGFKKLILDEPTSSITKTNSMMYIDLSGIAKGYAVDRIARHLDSLNITSYLVDIGGELVGRGKNQNNEPWRIGIEKPELLSREVQRIATLDNMAMATSGDYRNYFEKNGVRYSHTIDPTTGKPITHRLASVTVLHQQCMLADAYATAFQVMGPDRSLALANQLNLPLYMIVKSKDGFEERYNDVFKQYLTD